MDIVEIFKGKRVALIGNSIHVKHNEVDIDSYDLVCRMNNYELDFPNIGTRTDVYFFSFQPIIGFEERLGSVNICVANPNEKPQQKEIYENSDVPRLKIIGKSREDWHHVLGSNPSTGFRAMYFLHCMKCKEIYLTGFSFNNRDSDYYYKPNPDKVKTAHNYDNELMWLAYEGDNFKYDSYIGDKLQDEWSK